MILSDTEKFILEANRRHHSTKDKLLYVNIKMGALNPDGSTKMIYGRPVNEYVTKSKFYRTLGALQFKYAQRTEGISVNELPHMIDIRDEYEKQLADTLAEIDLAKADDQLDLVIALRKFYFEHIPYLTAIEEEIALSFDEGGLKRFNEANALKTTQIITTS